MLMFYNSIQAQVAPSIEWQKSLGGTSDDEAWSIQQTNDGGYIALGNSYSNDGNVTGNHGDGDCWIVKLDESGNLEWQKCLGGTGPEETGSVRQTTDGGYIVAGWTGSNDGDVMGDHGYYDRWIVKLDSIGDIQWQKCLGGTGAEGANSIQQTIDGGYIVVGWSLSNDSDVIKLDSVGDIQWQKPWGGTQATSAQQTADSGYIIGGYKNDFNGYGDYWVVKFDNSGTTEWQKSLGGLSIDDARSIQQTADGGYVVAGLAESDNGDVTGPHGGYDYWVVKLNDAGNLEWEKCLGGTGDDKGWFIQQTTDEGYIVAGGAQSNDGDVTGAHGDWDVWVTKIDSGGNLQWQKCLGGTNVDWGSCVQQTTDGGYIVAAYSQSNNGDVTDNHGGADFWIVKLSPSIPTAVEATAANEFMSIFPNPFSNSTIISFSISQSENISLGIFDLQGRLIRTLMNESISEGEHTLTWDVRNGPDRSGGNEVSDGIYLLKLQTDSEMKTNAIVVVR